MDHFVHSLISESKATLSEVAKSRITIVIAHNLTNEFKTCFLRLFLRSARTILLDRAFIFTGGNKEEVSKLTRETCRDDPIL